MRILSNDPRAIHLRTFQCQSCGVIQTFSKRKHKTKMGHEKTAYCFKCKKATNWTQID